MGFSRQEYWSGLPFPSPGDLPNPGIESRSPALLLMLSRFSHVALCATPYMAAHQAPPSLGFSRQEHWSGWHSLLQGIFPTQGSNPGLPHCRQTLYCLSHREGHRLFYSQGPAGVYKPILTRATQRQPVFIVLSSGLLPIFWVQNLPPLRSLF